MKKLFVLGLFSLFVGVRAFSQQYFTTSVKADIFKFKRLTYFDQTYPDRMFSVMSYSTSLGYSKTGDNGIFYDIDFSRGFVRSYYKPSSMLIILSYTYGSLGIGYVFRHDKPLKISFSAGLNGMNYLATFQEEMGDAYMAVGSFFTLTPMIRGKLIYDLRNFDIFTGISFSPVYNLMLSPLSYSYKGSLVSWQVGLRFRLAKTN